MATTSTEDKSVITGATVFDGDDFLSDRGVVLRGDAIEAVLPLSDCPGDQPRVHLPGGILAPGFVDLQVNGGGGVMFNACPDSAGAQTIARAHRRLGTTGIVPTVMSDTTTVQRAAAEAVSALQQSGHPGILGLHIEGPFFNPTRRGAHSADLIRPPQPADIDWLCSLDGLTVILTLAPEQISSTDLQRLADSGILLCAGHTEASADEINAASASGLQGITHLHNAMRPTTAREPGAAGAALADNRLWAGIIADGHHVHPANIQIAYRAKPPGRLVLVSDAMATAGSDSNAFELYGERIELQEGRLVNADGVLAGSAIGLIDAVQIAHQEADIPLQDCLRMASRYPAGILGLDGILGSIKPGYRADLVHFGEDFEVTGTWLAGEYCAHN